MATRKKRLQQIFAQEARDLKKFECFRQSSHIIQMSPLVAPYQGFSSLPAKEGVTPEPTPDRHELTKNFLLNKYKGTLDVKTLIKDFEQHVAGGT